VPSRSIRTRAVAAFVALVLLGSPIATAAAEPALPPVRTSSAPVPLFRPPARVTSWPGRWIWASGSATNQWVAFRKTLTLPAKPKSAVAQIACDTKYWLWVNQHLVTFEGGLKRGPNPHDTYYDTVDIAPYLQPGKNVIAVLVWHFGKSGFSHVDSGRGGLVFQTNVALPGGARCPVYSDGSWKAAVHPGYKNETGGTQPNRRLAESNVYYDETAATRMGGWQTAGYDDSRWRPTTVVGGVGMRPWNRLQPRPTPALSFTDWEPYVNASSLPRVSPGGTITAKLPSNLQVTPLLVVQAPAGTVIRMQTDHYKDGGEYGVRATYVTKSGVSKFEALGWMSGTAVRYAIPKGVRIVSLGYRESGYPTTLAGGFGSSDPFLTRLWDKAARTMYLNMRDTWMDCPTRERAQWWGDEVNEMQSAMYAFDPSAVALTTKGVRELSAWRHADRTLPSVVPGTMGKELPQQDLASVWALWPYYLYTGDRATAVAAYPAAKAYLDLWSLGRDGLVVHRPGDWDWVDWGGDSDTKVLENAWYAMAVRSAIHLAVLSGNVGDAAALVNRQRSIQRNFDRVLWNAGAQAYRSPGYRDDTDDRGNALAVVAGLAPETRYAGVSRVLRTRRHASPYMELYVLRAMYVMGDAVAAEQRMHDRYGPMVTGSGYTLWEYWSRGGCNTDDHAWGAGPVYALGAYAAGIVPTAPGYSSYQVQPQLGTLQHLSASVSTVRGRLSVTASNDASGYSLGVTAPPRTSGSLVVPVGHGGQVTLNGTTVYRDGRQAGSVRGASVAVTSATDITLRVGGGTWTAVTSVRQPSSGMRNRALVNR
jgi:alpha-L-rhamnosidase